MQNNIIPNDTVIDLDNSIHMTIDRTKKDSNNTIVNRVLFNCDTEESVDEFNKLCATNENYKKMIEMIITKTIAMMREKNETYFSIPVVLTKVSA